MRGLRHLEPALAAGSGVARRKVSAHWEDRHRATFLLVVAAIVCLGMAGYLWARMPRSELQPAPPTSAADIRSTEDAFRLYSESQKGLSATPYETTPDEKTRQQMLWGIGIAAAGAAAAGVGAILVALRKTPGRK
jgi:hypothetical protein